MTFEECEQLVLCYAELVEEAHDHPENQHVCQAAEFLQQFVASLVHQALVIRRSTDD